MSNTQSRALKGVESVMARSREKGQTGEVRTLLLDNVEPDPDQVRASLVVSPEEVRQAATDVEGLTGADRQNGLIEWGEQKALTRDDAEHWLGVWLDTVGLAGTVSVDGPLSPIVVYKRADRYRIMVGGRRYLACILAGLSRAPCAIRPKPASAYVLSRIQLVENLSRVDLPLEDVVRGLRRLGRDYEEDTGKVIDAETIMDALGASRAQAFRYRRIATAPDELVVAIAAQIRAGTITSLMEAQNLVSKPDPEKPGPRGRGDSSPAIRLGTSRSPAAIRALIKLLDDALGEDAPRVDKKTGKNLQMHMKMLLKAWENKHAE